jgi:hypothetical protein
MRARGTVPASVMEFLRRELSRGRMVLFTGAGFSTLAHDMTGQRRVPTGTAFADELWRLCFPDEQRDASTLQDLFQHALRQHRDRLAELVDRRLRVSDERLPPFYQYWFDMPWRRIYTLNVDDLEEAATRRFKLTRQIRTLSALRKEASDAMLRVDKRTLDVIHLNGTVEDGPEAITFSTLQYAERLAGQCALYTQLVRDFGRYPMLFVGTKLEESPLWQAIEIAGVRKNIDATPPGLLVTQEVTRARRSLLESLHIAWLPMDVRAFAEDVLAPLRDVIPKGLAALERTREEGPVEDAQELGGLGGTRH